MVWKSGPEGRVAKSLLKLLDQIDAAHPGRKKGSDGTIGDVAHRARKSDHNPDGNKVVKALDITHDPAGGVDSYALAEWFRAHPDKRLRYIISNKRIAGNEGYVKANGGKLWTWAPYGGSNPHDKHVHFSAVGGSALYDDVTPFALPGDVPAEKPADKPPAPVTGERLAMAKAILDFEARRDKDGHLAIYDLPANDGGGRYEVAGINEKYNGPMVLKLVELIKAGKHDEAETEAVAYIASQTDVAATWTNHPSVESYLRDTVFNRGPTGAARILQRAVGVKDDGHVGPATKAAMGKLAASDLLLKLRAAREAYEREVVGFRANLWNGLVNRWNKALTVAQSFWTTPVEKAKPLVSAGELKAGSVSMRALLTEAGYSSFVSDAVLERIVRTVLTDVANARQQES